MLFVVSMRSENSSSSIPIPIDTGWGERGEEDRGLGIGNIRTKANARATPRTSLRYDDTAVGLRS